MTPEKLPKNPEQAYDFPKTHNIAEIHEILDSDPSMERLMSMEPVGIAGRIVSTRDMGRIAFTTLADHTGSIQLILEQGETDGFEDLSRTQNGDWIGAVGKVGYSKRNERSIYAEDWSYLARTDISFPNFREGISDDETRIRQRYLDLAVNPDSLARFKQRSKIVQGIRDFMKAEDFMEVETPTFHPIAGGASARPFTTHHNALDTDFYLRIAPELYLKRLVVGGLERVYEIGKNFRNEGVSTRHNPEFTMMEVYAAYWDCEDQMNFTERLVNHAVREARGSEQIDYQGEEVDFSLPWKRHTMDELASEATGEELSVETDIRKLRHLADKLEIDYNEGFGPGRLLAEIFEKTSELDLRNPTFVTDYPEEISPLARSHRSRPGYTERFEVFAVGRELCNGYTELNNAEIQLQRFIEQEAGKEFDPEAMSIDHDYVKALRYGLPPTGGMGIGIDRLTMLLTNTASIRDVILFPSLRKLG